MLQPLERKETPERSHSPAGRGRASAGHTVRREQFEFERELALGELGERLGAAGLAERAGGGSRRGQL